MPGVTTADDIEAVFGSLNPYAWDIGVELGWGEDYDINVEVERDDDADVGQEDEELPGEAGTDRRKCTDIDRFGCTNSDFEDLIVV